jgi:D-glycero-D-manno-heptose 1,7-bisphosphate phosphatase
MVKKSYRPAAFLDRDGVLNEDNGYAYRSDQIKWIPGAKTAVKFLNSAGYFVFVVTNQTGIARNLYSENDVKVLHKWMNVELAKAGAQIDDFRFSPFHPDYDDGRYRCLEHWRKPSPGMLFDLMKHWPIEKTGSFMVGDRSTDIEAAEAADIPGFLFLGDNLLEFVTRIVTNLNALK